MLLNKGLKFYLMTSYCYSL